jgi:midasin (ATPase involved in ribosome maturation)
MNLFKDMTSRDLLSRRTTDNKGNTIWVPSAIVNAAQSGHLLILDGLDRLPPSTVSILASLVEDRSLVLSDGSRLMRADRYDKLRETISEARAQELLIYRIHPSFRILALALPPDPGHPDRAWIREETMALFSFHYMPKLTVDTKVEIVSALFPGVDRKGLTGLLRLFEQSSADDAKAAPVTSARGRSVCCLLSAVCLFVCCLLSEACHPTYSIEYRMNLASADYPTNLWFVLQ